MTLVVDTSPSSLAHLARLLDCANQNAALVIEALCSQSALLSDGVLQSQANRGQVEVGVHIRVLVGQSQLARLPPSQVPRFLIDRSAPYALGAELTDRPGAGNASAASPSPDRYSVHCTPQIHGAFLEQLRHARQVLTDAPVLEPDAAVAVEALVRPPPAATHDARTATAAFGLARIKAAIAALSSISERRLAKLLDPTQNHGLPASLVPNPDGNHYGLMVLRYRAAVLVSELSDLATPVSSNLTRALGAPNQATSPGVGDPTSANRMIEALKHTLALERYAAIQALRVRMAMLAHIHGPVAAPIPGEFALTVLDQFDRAGLQPIWDGKRRPHDIDTVRRLLLESPATGTGNNPWNAVSACSSLGKVANG